MACPSRILVINPGSTSTKLAVYKDENPVLERLLTHSPEEPVLCR